MSKKILCISDVGINSDHMKNGFSFLEQYDAKLEIVEDLFNHSRGELQAFFRKMEAEGPDALPENKEVLQKIKDADILIGHLNPICSSYLDAAEHLEVVALLRSGMENIDRNKAKEAGIRLVLTPGRISAPVADYTVGLMLAETRNIVRGDRGMRSGIWEASYPNDGRIHTLRNAVIGLIGYGQVGKKVAARLVPFGAKIIVYDPYCRPEDIEADGFQPVSLEELLKTCDIMSMHFRLTEDTAKMIGKKELDMMKPSAYIINTARAGLIDEEALVKALEEKRITGAALDVYMEEPLPAEHPLRKLDNVTLSPHLAGVCCELEELSMEILAADLERYLKGEVMVNEVKL
ncbi:2-hydroxyacid dehydrogenase [Clostridium sp. AM58-1XD]|uniref:2-hydroxyacid dehydrogenase n=1 Tax=Clostridium sp. AM58-1XD TaxID=2292307 RepID=UPI000E4DB0CE|nr:2-hydroxyacid dehydrogenase [Clostridium sp. AM58-1XD]RGY99238.1 hypothetical protein DXA13_08425 [Clostridium sp. AM58-1XD]